MMIGEFIPAEPLDPVVAAIILALGVGLIMIALILILSKDK